ncbi:hypothetical protein P43SY_009728 [Pythium insidiosum]|uniref:Transmembrane protein n=1 Tax=Pythium insidiosum TaxID=114742 RepID=A0AAD5QBP1_PYTIN|nr:hypothetical protein P43SY_009728 [Pythium insidiosum]KAJ0405832.1 hypothetical protein ATCC90586_001695 [Pythium insidiosum]
MMSRGGRWSSRFVLALLVLAAVLATTTTRVVAESKDAETVREETVDAAGERPPLSEEAFAKIFSKLSNKCQKEIEANPTDPKALSDRCRVEVGRKIERHFARQNEPPKPKKKQQDKKPKQQDKPKKKKARKQNRKQAEASGVQKEQEKYNDALVVIGGFVATLVAVVIGAMCVINRKLKAAGMYYPANPEEKAGGCCG